jgi:hypothetical protein
LSSESEPGTNLIARAKAFAITRHTLIGHRRKYTKLPYSEHLQNVANLVASVTDDPETLAAAWLHDVVEDTPVTIENVEGEFGTTVAALVEALTDVSKPGDGNRAVRKAMDRKHLAAAESRAKTVKLADLIDNCQDIAKHDPQFARVYLREMAALLEVLHEGDSRLYDRATRVYNEWAKKLGLSPSMQEQPESVEPGPAPAWQALPRVIHLFLDGFRAQDIAEPLRSFDAERLCLEVEPVLEAASLDVVGLRVQGIVRGYARTVDLTDGCCADHLRTFRQGQVVRQEAPLSDVIHILTICEHAFLSAFNEIVGVIDRGDVNKPVTRMWLFGVVTLAEMELTRLVDAHYPDESWHSLLPGGRLERATTLREERLRRKQPCRLVDCLQLSDKAHLLLQHPEGLRLFGLDSKRVGKQVIREMESLRNNLAHGQDIVTYDWAPIARIATRLSEAATDGSAGDADR